MLLLLSLVSLLLRLLLLSSSTVNTISEYLLSVSVKQREQQKRESENERQERRAPLLTSFLNNKRFLCLCVCLLFAYLWDSPPELKLDLTAIHLVLHIRLKRTRRRRKSNERRGEEKGERRENFHADTWKETTTQLYDSLKDYSIFFDIVLTVLVVKDGAVPVCLSVWTLHRTQTPHR